MSAQLDDTDSYSPASLRAQLTGLFGDRAWLWLVPAVVLVTESLIAAVNPTAGIALYCASVGLMLIALSRESLSPRGQALAFAIMAGALIRIMTVALQFTPALAPLRREHMMLIAALGTLAVVAMAARHVPSARSTFDRASVMSQLLQIAALLFGMTFGTILLAMQRAGLAAPINLVPQSGARAELIIAVVAVAVFAFSEELLFRRVLQPAFERYLHIGGTLLAACVQATLLTGYLSPVVFFFALFTGITFGLLARASGSTTGVALGHSLGSLTVVFLGPFYGLENLFPAALVCSATATGLIIVVYQLHARGQAQQAAN
jgi:membrane protease YdiL (CAAX protease family)